MLSCFIFLCCTGGFWNFFIAFLWRSSNEKFFACFFDILTECRRNSLRKSGIPVPTMKGSFWQIFLRPRQPMRGGHWRILTNDRGEHFEKGISSVDIFLSVSVLNFNVAISITTRSHYNKTLKHTHRMYHLIL